MWSPDLLCLKEVIEIATLRDETDRRIVELLENEKLEILIDGVVRYSRTVKAGNTATAQFSIQETKPVAP